MPMNVRRLTVSTILVLCMSTGLVLCAASPSLAATEYSAVGSFGDEGSGDGQFNEGGPEAIAVDELTEPLTQPAAGDVYVVDGEKDRVERFSATGSYLSQWDGSATQAKSFSPRAHSIAVDNSGNPIDPSVGDVYVVDRTDAVVDQFSPEGGFTGLELKGTCEAPGTCAGKVIPFSKELSGIAVDPSGNIFVVEENGTVDERSEEH